MPMGQDRTVTCSTPTALIPSAAMKFRVDRVLCREILRIAVPMILSMSGFTIMNFVDGVFLARHSSEAVAAAGTAGLVSWLLTSFFVGIVGFTSTIVAHYHGSNREAREGVATWQGIRLAVLASGLLTLLSLFAGPLFRWVGHEPIVQANEIAYFQVMTTGSISCLVATAVCGFFLGRGETRYVFICQIAGQLLNAACGYGLIFGKLGMPEWGMIGAAVAAVLGQTLVVVLILIRFMMPRYRQPCGTWSGRHFDASMTLRLLKFGIPNGFRSVVEMMAWTAFLFFIGRIGTTELAASTIAWRINGLVFFPTLGLSEAIRTLVGQSQARKDVALSLRTTWNGLFLAEVWMVAGAVVFLLFGQSLFQVFEGSTADSDLTQIGVVLLRFVAAYSLLDACNLILVATLVAAGDTRVTFRISIVMYSAFVALLALADHLQVGLMAEWWMATFFVMITALVWLVRIRSSAWHNIEVVEPALE